MSTDSSLPPPETVPPQDGPPSLGNRVLYMIVFGVAFWMTCWALVITAIGQLVLRLLNGKPHADLTRFGESLGTYAKQLIEYLTFATEKTPFPFSEWPALSPHATGTTPHPGQ